MSADAATISGHAWGRALIGIGAGAALGVVFGLPDTLALDTGLSSSQWYPSLAASLGLGLVIAAFVVRAVANLGTAPWKPISISALLGAGAWLALINIGETTWVLALVVVAVAFSTAPLVLGSLDATPEARRDGSVTSVASQPVSIAIGAALGTLVMFLDPTIVWSDVTAVAGAVLLVGALFRLRGGTDGTSGAVPTGAGSGVQAEGQHAVPSADAVAPLVVLAATVSLAAAAVVRIGGPLQQNWDAGVRYLLLSLSGAALTSAAGLVAVMWSRRANSSAVPFGVGAGAPLVALAAGSLVFVAISETLIGTVVGVALTAGVATVVVTGAAAAAASAAPTPNPASATRVILLCVVCWTVGWVAWPALVDAAGSQRVALFLLALPALVISLPLWLRVDESAGVRSPATKAGAPTPQTAPGAAPTPGAVASVSGRRPGTGRQVLLRAEGIEYSYGPVQVLFGVDLTVHQGEVVALMGTNGAGKTTFLRTVAGLATPGAGTISYAGGDLARFSASDRVALGINQIATGATVAGDLTVRENLDMFGHTLARGDARSGAQRALEVFPRLGERLGQRAGALSGGERQMLALSKSLVLRPRLLVIDECTLGLAPIAVAQLVPVIRQLHEEGSAVLLVEQSVHLALDLADRACCMEKGEIVYESDADDLRNDPGLLEAVYLEGISAALEQRTAGAS